ncbi:uncharacterized protein [Amphiura filiformis]|uniref:uncharacterized protein isoform X2 n=1 Tax=Amphiura filiformis TaxID=82378 RepID=UPI003B2279FB
MALEDPIPASSHGDNNIRSVSSPSGSCAGNASTHGKPPNDAVNNNDQQGDINTLDADGYVDPVINQLGAGGDADNHKTQEVHSEHFGDGISDTWSSSTPRDCGDNSLSILGDWHGFRGRPIQDAGTMEFNRQLDHVAVWLEKWKHNERLKILEGLLHRSNYTQHSFLWTATQPTLHRDFMYTSQLTNPGLIFPPISSHVSRDTKARRAVRNYHHVKSAHVQNRRDVMRCNAINMLSRGLNPNGDEIRKPTSPPNPNLANVRLPSLSQEETKESEKQLKKSKSDANKLSKSAPAGSRLIEVPPIRRHMEMKPRPHRSKVKHPNYHPVEDEDIPKLTKALSAIQLRRSRPTMSGTKTHDQSPVPVIPMEAWQLYHWYAECWTDVQRNEFLHKLLKRLDSRQLYFISSYLSLKHARDIIGLLPESLALHIFKHLTPNELLVAAQVSRLWNERSSHDEVWKEKCDQVNIEVPIPLEPVHWKSVYRDNVLLGQNWETGNCATVDVKGHTDKVLCVTFDGGHQRLASGSKDATIKLWDIRSGALIQTLKGHKKGVWCLRFFTQHLLISGSFDGRIKIWNLRKFTCARTMFGHEGPVWAIAQKKNLLASASQDKTLKLWDLKTCGLVHNLVGHNQAVFCVDMDDDATMVISGSADRSVRIWSVETGTYTRLIWASQTTSIMSLSYDKGYFAIAVGEVVSLWRLDTATCIQTFEEHHKRVEAIGLRVDDTSSPDTPRGLLVTGGKDGMVKYWDIDKSKSRVMLRSRGSEVNAIFFDETKIVCACADFKLKIWNFHIVEEMAPSTARKTFTRK